MRRQNRYLSRGSRSAGRNNFMEYFYIPELKPGTAVTELSGAEARHMTKVLRYQPGDEVYATNGRGQEFRLIIRRLQPTRVTLEVCSVRAGGREPKHPLTLAPAVLKGDKLSQVVEAAAELGVKEIIPFRSARVVGRLSETRYRRLRQVAVSGMKTALRTVLPQVRPAREFSELVADFPQYERVVVAYEEERVKRLEEVLEPAVESVLVVIGPEGGFTPEEAAAMSAAGARLFTLGPRRLRAETAAIAAVTLCLARLGDLQ